MTDDESEWELDSDSVAAGDDRSEADHEWRYSLSDLDDEAETETDEQSAVGGNVFGSLSSDTEVIEANSPSLEGTLFVVAGAVLALLFFLQFYLLMG